MAAAATAAQLHEILVPGWRGDRVLQYNERVQQDRLATHLYI